MTPGKRLPNALVRVRPSKDLKLATVLGVNPDHQDHLVVCFAHCPSVTFAVSPCDVHPLSMCGRGHRTSNRQTEAEPTRPLVTASDVAIFLDAVYDANSAPPLAPSYDTNVYSLTHQKAKASRNQEQIQQKSSKRARCCAGRGLCERRCVLRKLENRVVMCDRLKRLIQILQENQQNDDSILASLRSWSDDMESFLSARPGAVQQSNSEPNEDTDRCTIPVRVSWLLLNLMLGAADTANRRPMSDTVRALLPCMEDADTTTATTVSNNGFEERTDDWEGVALSIIQRWKEDCSAELSSTSTEQLKEILRASKAWMRWFLQIYNASPLKKRNNNDYGKDPSTDWRSRTMLELYLVLLENYGQQDPAMAQCASQLFFYASYAPVSGSDKQLVEDYDYLLNERQLASILLERMIQSTWIPLSLSLVRNVHNVMVSFPKGTECVANASFDITTSCVTKQDLAPWVPNAGLVNFRSLFRQILMWAIQTEEPRFPGDEVDKRAELVNEIFRIFFILRVGASLESDEALIQVILDVLRTDSSDERCYECQLGAVSLFMDAPASFGLYLLKHNAVDLLLGILDAQVTSVVEQELVNDPAAAALTPILIVLHKFSSTSATFRLMAKEYIFPPESEENFRRLVAQEQAKTAKAKNVSPLDAPMGSRRWKIIHLMTWPHSQIKRFAGELLWILCDSNAQEYIYRVGMGNAIVILGSKGLAQLPAEILS